MAILLLGITGDGHIERHPISINLPQFAPILKNGEFFLKNYSELEKLAGLLIKHQEIEIVGPSVKTGFVEVPVARIRP
jgi:hypothetical protein